MSANYAALVFQSTLSMRRATGRFADSGEPTAISIHALHEESDVSAINKTPKLAISIHALHEESDRRSRSWAVPYRRFQSTLSMRRATFPFDGFNIRNYISIHALHEESDFQRQIFNAQRLIISIHALHEESDQRGGDLPVRRRRISIHALHEESDGRLDTAASIAAQFQSTLSMRRATNIDKLAEHRTDISIHALHEESDRLELPV